MAISYPLSFPSSPKFVSATLRMVNKTAIKSSPFTGAQQITAFPGQWWEMDVRLPAMTRAEADYWVSFLAKLDGQVGTFLAGDPDAATARGTPTGTPVVNGGSQTGHTLVTDGWTSSTPILKAGDYIQIGNNLYKNLDDVTSDGSGNATLTVWPKVRTAHSDNASITVRNAKGLFRLKDNTVTWSTDSKGFVSLSFSAEESL